MPKVDKSAAPRYERQAYPGSLRHRTNGCWKTRLSDQVGLTQFSVGEVTLAPGSATGLHHWHENEDEFVYVLEGEVTMVEGEEEFVLGPGDCAGWRAGVEVGHTFENRSDKPARLLEMGPRNIPADLGHYTGLDMLYHRNDRDILFTTRAGVSLSKDDEPRRFEDFRSAPLPNRPEPGE